MVVLVDTGILLRFVNRAEPEHVIIRRAVRALTARGDALVTSPQNVAEFWNVCTRPASARGGYGLSIEPTYQRLRLLERAFPVLSETAASYAVWKNLVLANGVKGTKAHDARLVALMKTHGITEVLTLNESDFLRFAGINVLTPSSIISTPPDAAPA
ncbi:MAG TPA: type II toxin-antitoxin system VapC family toxin [Gemmataceae bacterium]|nr:type II toxin-antitoxin system VapC family toxin [Gemmataceae bacterium]